MKSKYKFGIGLMALCILLIVVVTIICFSKSIVNEKEYKEEQRVEKIHAVYKYNVNDLSNIVADADYVFIAKVDSVVNTVYKNAVKIEDSWISNPYTQYKLKIEKNIKGKLNTKRKITVLKAGGKGKKTNMKYVFHKDSLPIKGKYYIFAAYVQKDGSLLVSGANSSLIVNKKYTSSNNYKRVMKALKKKRIIKRTRYSIQSKKIYK